MNDWMENKEEKESMVRRILREYSDRAGDAAAVSGLLDEVGAYYGAERVYLSEGNAASADVLTAPIGADGWICVEGARRSAEDTLVLYTAAGVLSGWRAAERRLQLVSRAMEDQNSIIRSLSGIYASMYYIDLQTGRFTECTSVDVVHGQIGTAGDAQDRLNYFCRNLMMAGDAAEMLKFVDLSTLEERMAQERIIRRQYRSTAYATAANGFAFSWHECAFIECDRGLDGRLAHVLFTTQSINEAKKRELEAQQKLVDTNVDLTALLAAEKQHTAIIRSLSNIYFALFYIDLVENSYQEVISLRDQPFKLEEKTDARVALQRLAERLAEAAYRPAMRSFTNFDTIGQRLGDKSMIIQEFMAQSGGWVRCGFVPVERDGDGRSRTVLCTLRWITGEKEERALQENLVQALALPYHNIYAVDVDTGEAVCCRMGRAMNDRYGEEFAIGSYEQNVHTYVANDVLPEDWPLFEKAGTVRGVCELLRDQESYAFTYRVARNQKVEYFQCQLVMPDRRRNKFVVAFRSVDEQMAREQAQQRRVEEALAEVEKINASLEEEMAISDALSREYSSLFKIDARTGKMSLYRTDGVGISAELLGKLMALGDYETVLSKYIDVFVMPEDQARIRESSALPALRERVPEVGLYKQGYRRIMNGVVSYYEMNVVRTRGAGGETTFILGMRDVDEEVRRQLKQSRELEVQREIIEGLGSEYYSVLLVDPKADTVEVYRAEEEDGRAIERYIRKQDNCWSRVIDGYARELVSDASRAEFRDKLSLDHIKAGGKEYSLTYEKLTEKGTIYLQARVSFVHEKDGGLVAVVGTRNVDDLIKKEREQEAALQLAFDAAEAANRAKTDFLSNMSHDIRTPMNGIIGMTAIAAAHLDDRERVQDSLQKITQASKHLLSLINEVLDMSKIEARKVDLIEEEFNLSDLVDNLLTMTSAQVEAHRHELSVNISGVTHEAVVGDSLRIQKVFTNLMGNAVKYTPDGGRIQLSITEKPSNQAKVGCFEFVFEDNGIGMSEAFVQKIFEPFSRAEDEQVHHIQGTGLGLSISRNIVRMMGGDIKVESKLGKGTKFTVTMYLKLQDVTQVHYEKFVDLDVLVADDDALSLESCCGMLNDLGMKAEGVDSGAAAVEKVVQHHAQQRDYFACIIDWKMPDMDGIATTRAIRKAVGKDVPIIIISAYDWSDIEQEARAAGANAFISKPLFRSRLARTFSALVDEEECETPISPLVTMQSLDFTGRRVLLVEDNDLNAEIAQEVLEMAGIAVERVADGIEAVDAMAECADGTYDMVLMDIQMPKMNGYDATRAIRAMNREYCRQVPIIAMTANAFAEDVQAARTVGMNEHIAKPLDLNVLARTLLRWMK